MTTPRLHIPIPIPGLCNVCHLPKDPALPFRCRCRGLLLGSKLVPLPKGGGFRITATGVKRINKRFLLRPKNKEETKSE